MPANGVEKVYVDGVEAEPVVIRKLDRETKKPISQLVKEAPARHEEEEE